MNIPKPWIVAELTRRPAALSYYWEVRTGEDRECERIAIIPAEYPGDDAGEKAIAELIAQAPALLAERDQLKADNARLREALTAVLRYCVTVEGMPDSDKGRTPHQACAMKQARQALA